MSVMVKGGGGADLSHITATAAQILQGYVGSDIEGEPVVGTLVPNLTWETAEFDKIDISNPVTKTFTFPHTPKVLHISYNGWDGCTVPYTGTESYYTLPSQLLRIDNNGIVDMPETYNWGEYIWGHMNGTLYGGSTSRNTFRVMQTIANHVLTVTITKNMFTYNAKISGKLTVTYGY